MCRRIAVGFLQYDSIIYVVFCLQSNLDTIPPIANGVKWHSNESLFFLTKNIRNDRRLQNMYSIICNVFARPERCGVFLLANDFNTCYDATLICLCACVCRKVLTRGKGGGGGGGRGLKKVGLRLRRSCLK